jgi:hypothetical protein
MPAYVSSPAPPPTSLLTSNVPGYSLGSKANGPTTLLQVTRVSLTGNVATVTVQVREGNIPTTSGLITITGTQTASGAFNVTNKAITGVSIDPVTGQGTITFALSHADVSGTADAGQAYVPVPEIGEALTGSDQKGQAFAVSGYGISWAYTCPSAPSAISIQLEGAIDNVDSEFTIIGSAQTTTSGYNEFFATLPEFVRFARLHVTSSSGGTSPTIVGKVMSTNNPR